MKGNEKGFTLIEGLLIAVMLTLVLGVGFYVANSTKSTSAPAKSSSEPKTTSNKSNNEAKDPSEGWNNYTDSNNKFSLKYPPNFIQSNDENYQDLIYFKSSDKTITVQLNSANTKQITPRAYWEKESFGVTSNVIESDEAPINGQQALFVKSSSKNTKGPGTNYVNAYVFLKNGFIVQIQADPSNQDLLSKIAQSVKMN